MTDDERPAARGRPPGPSLDGDAVAILERNALGALRGPNSRGAVPRGAFANVDVSTVDRAVKRAFPGEVGRTPFDLASYRVCGTSEATRATMEAVFTAVAQSFRETDAMEETLRVFLRANFEQACREEGLLAISIVTAAACAHLRQPAGGEADQTAIAREILSMRRANTAELLDGFAAGLAIAMRRLRRRPKVTHSMQDIVLAIMASTDGFIHLHHMQADLVDVELVVETQWGIMWSLSEPGLLDPPNRNDEAERSLVDAALKVYASGQHPSRESLSRDVGVPWATTVALFPDETSLAQRCMDYAVGSTVETEAIAVGVRGAELAAIRNLLIATTQLATTTPLLIEIVRRDKNVGFCAEARRHIGEALGQSNSVSLNAGTADGVALMLLDAAMQGQAAQSVWEAGLDTFASGG
jgi:hypothetical protein